jgi:hypothetical protein
MRPSTSSLRARAVARRPLGRRAVAQRAERCGTNPNLTSVESGDGLPSTVRGGGSCIVRDVARLDPWRARQSQLRPLAGQGAMPPEARAERSRPERRHVACCRNAGLPRPLACRHCRPGTARRCAATVRGARSDARAVSAAVRRCASRRLRRGVGLIEPRRRGLPRVFARRERSRFHSGLVQLGTSRRDRRRGGPDRASPRGRRASVEDRSRPQGGSGCPAARVGLPSEAASGCNCSRDRREAGE